MFDILFVVNNRVEFTLASFMALVRNTDWGLVNKLSVYFDKCGDGWPRNPNWLAVGCETEIVFTDYGGPVEVMVDFLKCNEDSTAEWFVKVDNDVVVCPGWLDAIKEGIDWAAPWPIDLLGMEARNGEPGSTVPTLGHMWHGAKPSQFIGGVGAMRYSAFRRFPDLVEAGKYFGFGQWQTRHPEIIKAWIDPPLPTFLLDHLPFEPWRSLSERYVVEGIQRRQWGEYTEEYAKLWEWWAPDWKEKR